MVESPQQTDNNGKSWKLLVAVLLVASVARAGVLCVKWDGLSEDPDAYQEFADTLVHHGTLGPSPSMAHQSVDDLEKGRLAKPSAYRPPLYPIVLGATVPFPQPMAIAVLHFVLGVATVWLTVWLGQLWGWQQYAYLAGLLVALDPILLNQTAQVMTETLATFLAVLALLALTWTGRRASWISFAGTGIVLGLSVLCRPTFLPFLLCGLIVLGQSALFGSTRWRNVLALATAAGLMLAPWAIRNYCVLGAPTVTTTHGGFTFWLGNNESFFRYARHGEWGEPWREDMQWYWYAENPSERELDRAFYRYAFDDIRADPAGFALACGLRLSRLWGVLPYQTDPAESAITRGLRYAVAIWYTGVWLLAVAGWWTLGRRSLHTPLLWGVLLVGTFTAVHTFYWANLRMRAPLMPVVALSAAIGVSRVFIRRRKSAD